MTASVKSTDLKDPAEAGTSASATSNFSTHKDLKDASSDSSVEKGVTDEIPKPPRDFRFWMIIISLSIAGALAGLESTIVTTALPTIVEELDIGADFIWLANAFFLTAAAVQPFFGQVANIWGRRWLTIGIVVVYLLGSGICGGATNGAMLIAGRAVQGVGSGGLNMIIDVIVSDLVPLRERGNFIAVVLTVYSIGTTLGPFAGGAIVQTTTWRWAFWLNFPIGGVALVLLFMFLHVKYNKEMTFTEKLKRLDYIGNIIIIGSTIAVLWALTYAGARYPWSHWRILVPLILGLVGFVGFFVFEASGIPRDPVTPIRLLKNRTTSVVAVITFMNSALVYWAMYFLPVYFQAVLRSSPARSGVQLLPLVLVAIPGAIIAVLVLTKTGRYRPMHFLGLAIVTLGLGLFALLDTNSSMARWVIFQIIAGLGSGMVLNTLLPAFQAPLAESDQAAATSFWAFIRSFGSIWGVAIPAAIFTSRTNELAAQIVDPVARAALSGGDAYQHATASFVNSFAEETSQQVVSVFTESLATVWQVSVAFSGFAFLLVFFEKEIKLRTELDTEFGMEDKKDKKEKSNDTAVVAEGSS